MTWLPNPGFMVGFVVVVALAGRWLRRRVEEVTSIELIDGTTGLLPGNENLPDRNAVSWAAYWEQVERAASGLGRPQ